MRIKNYFLAHPYRMGKIKINVGDKVMAINLLPPQLANQIATEVV